MGMSESKAMGGQRIPVKNTTKGGPDSDAIPFQKNMSGSGAHKHANGRDTPFHGGHKHGYSVDQAHSIVKKLHK